MRDIDPNFDPALHILTDSSYFEDMSVGQRFVIPSRTLGDANFAAFQLASGDNHPIHYDVEYCRERVIRICWLMDSRSLFRQLLERACCHTYLRKV
jgi:acyl dehydratase